MLGEDIGLDELRCAEARRAAYRDVDKCYTSHRLSSHGWSRGQLQDSAAVVVVISLESRRKSCWIAAPLSCVRSLP